MCLWRLLLNAIVVVLLPGSSLQIVIALLIAVTMMFICAVLRPYRVDTNNDLAVLANAVLSLLLFTGLLIYLGATNAGSKRGLGLVGLIANLTCILLAFSGSVVVSVFCSMQQSQHMSDKDQHPVAAAVDHIQCRKKI